jgi:myosin heavy subunit
MADPKTPDFLAQDVAELAELENEIKNNPEQPPQEQEAAQQDAQQPNVEQDEDAVEGEDKGQFIRKQALYEERKRRKEATERSRQWEQRYTEDMRKANERLASLFQNAQRLQEPQKPAPQAPKIPDINEDPIGHFQAKQAELERKYEEQRQWQAQQDQVRAQTSELSDLSRQVTQMETEYAKTTPDYWEAQAHLMKMWEAEARACGIPEHDIPTAIQARSIETVQVARRNNLNPAQVAYQRAKALGYQSGQQPAQPQAPKTGPDLNTIKRGVEASKSVSTASGTAPAGIPSMEALLAMPEEEFAAKFGSSDNKNWDREMKRLMGIR